MHLTFVSKCWSASQAKAFRNSFCNNRSLIQCSLQCCSICEPLEKPVKCGLTGMNNQFYWNEQTSVRQLSTRLQIFWLSLVGYLHFNKRFDTWETFWIVRGGWGFDNFWSPRQWSIWPSKLPRYWQIWPKCFEKVKCPGVCRGNWLVHKLLLLLLFSKWSKMEISTAEIGFHEFHSYLKIYLTSCTISPE